MKRLWVDFAPYYHFDRRHLGLAGGTFVGHIMQAHSRKSCPVAASPRPSGLQHRNRLAAQTSSVCLEHRTTRTRHFRPRTELWRETEATTKFSVCAPCCVFWSGLLMRELDDDSCRLWPATVRGELPPIRSNYLKSLGAKSFNARRHESHSCAVPGDSK